MFEQFQRSPKPPDVNLVPLLDVLMSVLTFFLILSLTPGGSALRNIILPVLTANSSSSIQSSTLVPKEALNLSISVDGRLSLNSEFVDWSKLRQSLQEMKVKNANLDIYITADESLEYQTMSRLFQYLQSAEVNTVTLVLQKK